VLSEVMKHRGLNLCLDIESSIGQIGLHKSFSFFIVFFKGINYDDLIAFHPGASYLII